MLLRAGNFQEVELELEKYMKEEESERLEGGWHTEVSLSTTEHWTELHDCMSVQISLSLSLSLFSLPLSLPVYLKISGLPFFLPLTHTPAFQLRDMIENSKRWALARGLLRRNEVHGADEWRIPVRATFAFTAARGTSSTMRGTMELEEIGVHVLQIIRAVTA